MTRRRPAPSHEPARRQLVAGMAALALLGGASSRTAHAREPLRIVASFGILADLARAVGGRDVDVTSLIPPETEPHSFEPRPADARIVAAADLVLVNGLGFEGWLDRLVEASGFKGPVVTVSRGIEPRHGTGAEAGALDPHAWLAVPNAILYVRAIRDALAAADPAGAADRFSAADAYERGLVLLDGGIREAIARLPPDRRTVLTSHEAFGYYAAAYGLTFLTTMGLGEHAEPSAAGLAALIEQARSSRVTAIFVQGLDDARFAAQVARETGARVGGRLYSDTLSREGGPAATYVDLMRHNTRTIVSGLAERG